MKIILILLWLAVALCVALAGAVLAVGMYYGNTAIQEAVVCALASAMAILPYVGVRAIEGIVQEWPQVDRRTKLKILQLGDTNE